jgi:hypothetical protein
MGLMVAALAILVFRPERPCFAVDPSPEIPPPGSYYEFPGGPLCPLPTGPSAVRWWAAGVLLLTAVAILVSMRSTRKAVRNAMASKRFWKAVALALPAVGIILALAAWARPLPTQAFWCTNYQGPPEPCGEHSCGSVLAPKHEKPTTQAGFANWDWKEAAACDEELHAPRRAGFVFLSAGALAGIATLIGARRISGRARAPSA